MKIYKNKCPLCLNTLLLDDRNTSTSYKDYLCQFKKDHFFAKRVNTKSITKLKFRVVDLNGDNYFIKINYDQNNTEVWCNSNSSNKIILDTIPDIKPVTATNIINKIKTYILFS